jgi:hypothetical protein
MSELSTCNGLHMNVVAMTSFTRAYGRDFNRRVSCGPPMFCAARTRFI